MKKLSVFILVALMCMSVSAQKEMNDANAEKREVQGFHAIKISNAFDVYLTQGNEEALAISATEKEYRDHIRTTVENGVLKIWFDNDKKFWKGFNGNKMKLKAYVSFKNIDKLGVSGACDVFVVGTIKSDNLDISFSGASDMEGKFDVKNLTVNLSGASDMKITGSATQANIGASGASDFKGYDLETDICNAKASGASNIRITVNKELSAHASGASDVHYKGNGVIKDLKTSGASSVSKS